MAFRVHQVWPLLKQTFGDWSVDKVPRLGAALAFYTALSIAPLLVFSLRIAAAFFDDTTARDEIERQMGSLIGSREVKPSRRCSKVRTNQSLGTWRQC